jgi:endonuclease/exonuclease/phosphatase family metal-dependent hydrolase
MTINRALVFLLMLALSACATTEHRQRTVYQQDIEADPAITSQLSSPGEVLRVATLNIAHGRKDSVNQLLNGEATFRKNLDDVAAVLIDKKPHVVALQEADAVSTWSGKFDHVAYLANAAGYSWHVHAINADSWLYSYGTALLAGLPIKESIKHTFEPSPPTLDKGFVLASIQWKPENEAASRTIDFISVHLDFARKAVREEQIEEMIELLLSRNNPTIILGDFNSGWFAEASVVKDLMQKSRFTTYKPDAPGYSTYKNKRLDWILISKDMEFVSYNVLPDNLSDHAMIIADIRFKPAVDSEGEEGVIDVD